MGVNVIVIINPIIAKAAQPVAHLTLGDKPYIERKVAAMESKPPKISASIVIVSSGNLIRPLSFNDETTICTNGATNSSKKGTIKVKTIRILTVLLLIQIIVKGNPLSR
jgi:hypothetical protein